MLTTQYQSKEVFDFLQRNKITLGNPEFRDLLTQEICKPIDISFISVLQDFGLTEDDSFILIDILRRPNFKIWKVPPYSGFFRVYLYQAITSDFGFVHLTPDA